MKRYPCWYLCLFEWGLLMGDINPPKTNVRGHFRWGSKVQGPNESYKLDLWPLVEGLVERPKSGKSKLNLNGIILVVKSIGLNPSSPPPQKKSSNGKLMILKNQAMVQGMVLVKLSSIPIKLAPNKGFAWHKNCHKFFVLVLHLQLECFSTSSSSSSSQHLHCLPFFY